jgi:hypothetical protein
MRCQLFIKPIRLDALQAHRADAAVQQRIVTMLLLSSFDKL